MIGRPPSCCRRRRRRRHQGGSEGRDRLVRAGGRRSGTNRALVAEGVARVRCGRTEARKRGCERGVRAPRSGVHRTERCRRRCPNAARRAGKYDEPVSHDRCQTSPNGISSRAGWSNPDAPGGAAVSPEWRLCSPSLMRRENCVSWVRRFPEKRARCRGVAVSSAPGVSRVGSRVGPGSSSDGRQSRTCGWRCRPSTLRPQLHWGLQTGEESQAPCESCSRRATSHLQS